MTPFFTGKMQDKINRYFTLLKTEKDFNDIGRNSREPEKDGNDRFRELIATIKCAI